MPFCPDCRYEYRVEATICPDCNQQLVDHLPVERSAGPLDGDWVPAGRVQTQMKAEIARGALESNEIPIVMVTGSAGASGSVGAAGAGGAAGVFSSAGTASAGGAAGNLGSGSSGISQLTGDGSGGYTILVHREQVEDAQLILDAILGGEYMKEDIK